MGDISLIQRRILVHAAFLVLYVKLLGWCDKGRGIWIHPFFPRATSRIFIDNGTIRPPQHLRGCIKLELYYELECAQERSVRRWKFGDNYSVLAEEAILLTYVWGGV